MVEEASCELRLHASFEFHTAPYHVDIVRARVYVLDSRFQILDPGSSFSERGGVHNIHGAAS
jgi:hypothetical protein